MGSRQGKKGGYYLLYMFMIGLFLGILFVNIKHDIWMKEDGILNASMLKQLRDSEFDGGYLFAYIVKHRVFTVLIIGILTSTMIGLPILYGYIGYLGVSAGCLLSIAVFRYGIRGLFFMAASVFPQGFLLIPGYSLLFCWGLECNRSLYGRREGIEGRYLIGRQFFFQKGLQLFAIVSLILTGCVVESYVNPKIIHFILKLL